MRNQNIILQVFHSNGSLKFVKANTGQAAPHCFNSSSLFGRQNSFVVQTTLSKLTKLTKLTIKETHGIRNFRFAWDNCEIFTL